MMLDFRLAGTEPAAPSVPSRLVTPVESELYDAAIIGGGPAGLTAAVYCLRKGLRTLLVTEDIGGQMLWTSGIENYMGYQFITGRELAAKFEEQLRPFPLALERASRVARITAHEPGYEVLTEAGRRYQGRTVIVATGKQPRRLNIPGEKELTGRGVTYCATCDAPLYAGRDVAVVGGGNSALTSLLDLAGTAHTVYSIHRRTEYRGDPVLVEKVRQSPAIVPLLGFEPVAIIGTQAVEAIEARSTATGELVRRPVSGVFIEVGLIPNSAPVEGLLLLNEAREIVVNCRAEASRPGAFAAGDVTNVFEKQIIVAAGEGAKAALAAHAWLLGAASRGS